MIDSKQQHYTSSVSKGAASTPSGRARANGVAASAYANQRRASPAKSTGSACAYHAWLGSQPKDARSHLLLTSSRFWTTAAAPTATTTSSDDPAASVAPAPARASSAVGGPSLLFSAYEFCSAARVGCVVVG